MGVMLGIIGKTGFFRVYEPQWIWGKSGEKGVSKGSPGTMRDHTGGKLKTLNSNPPKLRCEVSGTELAVILFHPPTWSTLIEEYTLKDTKALTMLERTFRNQKVWSPRKFQGGPSRYKVGLQSSTYLKHCPK